jgi:hypothetical protein
MIQDDPKNKDIKKEKQDSDIKPDPETLGPDPQEHMEGPISSVVRKIGESAEENDEEQVDDDEKEDKEDKD